MKRALCMLIVLLMLLSLGMQAFAEEILFCRMCGKQIPADSKVCQYCGEKVIHPGQAAASAPAAQTAASAAPAAAPAAATVPVTPAAGASPSVAVKTAPSPVTAVPGPFNSGYGVASAPARVRVTKSPTSESVPYGGSCCFIAHAVNATTITWYIASADSSVISTVSDAARKVSGFYVSGANADTLYLSGIPSWMNGCQIQARFDGEGGPVYTDIARIWTYQPKQTNNGWCWWDWFKYYYECDPYYWDYPWYWYNYWLLNPTKAPSWFEPDRPEPPPEPRPVRPDPKPTYHGDKGVTGYWAEDNNAPQPPRSTAILTTSDRSDIIKVEKNDRSAWDMDILELVMEQNFKPAGTSGESTSGQGTSGQGTSGQGTSGQGTSGQGTSGQGTSGQNNSNDVPEGVMTSEWVD